MMNAFDCLATHRARWWTQLFSLRHPHQHHRISHCMPSHYCSPPARAYSTAPVRGPPPPPRKKAGGNPLVLLGGFVAIGAGGLYFFQKIAYSRGTVLLPGQEKKSKEYRQY